MNINGREIGGNNPPYLISEISCNHCGDLDKAVALIQAAKNAGADAVKFQAYTPDTITLNYPGNDFLIKEGKWLGWTLYDLYKEAHTPFEWFPILYEEADKIELTMFASVFDRSSIDMLEHLGCPAYKIASMEIVDTPLIKYAASTKKPLIISTGMASRREIDAAYRAAGSRNVALLACVSAYPSLESEPSLRRLALLQSRYPLVGLSDHCLWHEIPVAATAMGAVMIEKHLCLDRDDPSQDATFSITPEDFREMCDHVNDIYESLNDSDISENEMSSRQFRRSLYVTADIEKGEKFTPENIRSIRPGYGLDPARYPTILRRKAAVDIKAGTALTKEMIK